MYVNSFLLLFLQLLNANNKENGKFRVQNDVRQVKRSDSNFVVNGIYEIKNSIRFRLWTRENPILSHEIIVNDRQALRASSFNSARLTKIYVPGENHNANERHLDSKIAYLRDAYIRFADVNFIVMDWSELASGIQYISSNGDFASERLVQLLLFLDGNNSPLETIHLLGFSWGAHVCANTGRKLSGAVGRITGIDPSRAIYEDESNYYTLDSTDAHFVDVIHTDSGNLFTGGPHISSSKIMAHANFYVNGGFLQPGCPPKQIYHRSNWTCSHERGIEIFTESIGSPLAFASCGSDAWDKFLRSECPCTQKEITFLGEHCPRSVRGSQYLQTRGSKPYGLGISLDVILTSITRKTPTLVQTETGLSPRNTTTRNRSMILKIPNYATKNFTSYNDDVISQTLLTVAALLFK